MSSLKSKIESLLFISPRPLSFKKIAELVNEDKERIKKKVKELLEEYKESDRGIQIVLHGEKVQAITSPENAKLVQGFIKDEITGELTRPSLETLTIIAYRGPIAKSELEQIRGVNCSLILRNLMIRGLVEAREDRERMETYYDVTFDFLRFLGVSETKELPDYEKLSGELEGLLLEASQEK